MSKQLDPKPFRLAEEFADIIRNELTDDELVLVNERNAANGYEKLSCATHDFIDPNQSMLDAMESLNIEVDLDSDKQIALINEAWWMAQESNFALSKWNPGDQAKRRGESIVTNSERIHQLADSHAQGTHDSDPQFDCYDCYPWTTGYGAQVLASLSANTELTPEWWHSGGNLHGISVDHKGTNYFIGAADAPDVGMDINLSDGTCLGYGDFGSLEDYTPSQMAKRIWYGIKDGVGVTIYKENQ